MSSRRTRPERIAVRAVLRSLERATGDDDGRATADLTEFDVRRALADLDESATGLAATRRPVTLRTLHDFLG